MGLPRERSFPAVGVRQDKFLDLLGILISKILYLVLFLFLGQLRIIDDIPYDGSQMLIGFLHFSSCAQVVQSDSRVSAIQGHGVFSDFIHGLQNVYIPVGVVCGNGSHKGRKPLFIERLIRITLVLFGELAPYKLPSQCRNRHNTTYRFSLEPSMAMLLDIGLYHGIFLARTARTLFSGMTGLPA